MNPRKLDTKSKKRLLETVQNYKSNDVLKYIKNLPDEETLWLHSESATFEATIEKCKLKLKEALTCISDRLAIDRIDDDILDKGDYTSVMAKLALSTEKYILAYKEKIESPVKEWTSNTIAPTITGIDTGASLLRPSNLNFEILYVPFITKKYHSDIPIDDLILNAQKAFQDGGIKWENFTKSRILDGNIEPLPNPYTMEIETCTDHDKIELNKKLRSLLYEYVPPQEDIRYTEIEVQKKLLLQGSNSSKKYPGPFAEYLSGMSKSSDIVLPTKNLIYVDTTEGLNSIPGIIRSSKYPVITFDVEYYQGTYRGVTSLIQISTVENDIIIDPLPFIRDGNTTPLEGLNDIFCDPQFLKVGHGIRNDVDWLQRDCGIYLVNVFDTYVGANALNMPIRKSLKSLVAHFLKIKVDKGQQLSDWTVRPLTKSQLKYARLDTRLLIYVFHMMKNEMINEHKRENLVQSTLDSTARIAQQPYAFNVTSFHSLHSKLVRSKLFAQADPIVEFILTMAFIWREDLAKALDVASWHVAPDTLIYALANNDEWKDPTSTSYVAIEAHLHRYTTKCFTDDDIESLYDALKPYKSMSIDLQGLYECVKKSKIGNFKPRSLVTNKRKKEAIRFPEDYLEFHPPPVKLRKIKKDSVIESGLLVRNII